MKIYEFELEGIYITDKQKFTKKMLKEVVPTNRKLRGHLCSIKVIDPKKFHLIIGGIKK